MLVPKSFGGWQLSCVAVSGGRDEMAEHPGMSFVDGYIRLASQEVVGKPSTSYWPSWRHKS